MGKIRGKGKGKRQLVNSFADSCLCLLPFAPCLLATILLILADAGGKNPFNWITWGIVYEKYNPKKSSRILNILWMPRHALKQMRC